ncbi:MAG: Uncharacterized protein XD95_0082 [Microgenomates bacterium 39_7]|nr:MAG: Uncharacterized protein XD95_0082 [Microgenomates bacterium 39_7]
MPALKNIFSKLRSVNGLSKRLAAKKTIETELSFGSSYLVLLIGSSIVATLGLLINSSVVVMGAMLMAPLYWPIIGVALGIVSGNKEILVKALKMTLVSSFLALLFSVLVAYFSPLSEITHEIQVRASPTLLDLLIALTTSVIGVLAIYDPKVSSSVVGVALSLSLLPPLSAAGIGLSLGNRQIFLGAFQLFLANVIAIIFIGSITFFFLNFRPHDGEEKKRFSIGMSGSLLVFVGLAILFTFYLHQSIYTLRLTNQLDAGLRQELNQINQNIKLDNFNVQFVSEGSLWHANVEAMVYLPEDQLLSKTQQQQIAAQLGKMVSGDVVLQLNLVNTLIAERREAQRQHQLLEEEITKIINQELSNLDLDSQIVNLQVIDEKDKLLIELLLVTAEVNEQQSSLHDSMIEALAKVTDKEIELRIMMIPVFPTQRL